MPVDPKASCIFIASLSAFDKYYVTVQKRSIRKKHYLSKFVGLFGILEFWQTQCECCSFLRVSSFHSKKGVSRCTHEAEKNFWDPDKPQPYTYKPRMKPKRCDIQPNFFLFTHDSISYLRTQSNPLTVTNLFSNLAPIKNI